MTTIHPAILVCALSALTACVTEENAQVHLRSVHQSPYCGDEAAGLRWLSSQNLIQILRGPSIGKHLDADQTPLPNVAENEKLLLVSLGHQNSGGHGVALASLQTPIQEKVIKLPLDIHQPAPGSMQTLQITSPCLVIALRGNGYKKVESGALGSVTVED